MRRRFRCFALESPGSVSMAGRWSKALLAAALGLGTFGTTLALVDVAPASATGIPTITSISPTSGALAGGSANKITITGTNFETKADDTVDFGPGNPGTVFSEASGTSMVVYPPAATQLGSVQMTVTTSVSGGTSNAVTYTYAAAPTVTALYSANAPTTGGTTIIITGNNFVGPGAVTAVKFNTTAATSYTVNSNTNISAVVPVMPDTDMAGKTYYVTVTTDSGTSAEGPGSAWYWFGSGTCTMSGPGVQNSGAPPGASAYILDASQAVGGSTGTTVSGSTTFSDPTASFTSSEVGQTIVILGAGPTTSGVGYTTPSGLSTTIASVVSPTEVTLAAPAQTSISGSAQWDLTSLANNTDGTIAASSTTFTTTGADFSAADVGDTIDVTGAGVSGGPLVTTVAAFVSATQITLGTAASTALSGNDGTTTALSTTFTTANADFIAADVGDTIDITGAGPAGATLVTTISAVNSSTSITLGTAASTTVSGNAAWAISTAWAIYNTTVIGTACTGLSGLALTAPMIESLSDPEASVVSGTGPNGGPGGDETFLGWSGQNGYSTDVNGSYNAGFVLPFSGPNTTGGCPLEPGATGLCALAQGEGTDAFFGTDPQGTCPPTQAEANAGFVQCSLAALTADETDNSYIATAVDVAYANDPTPANPTAAITPSTGLSAGQTVTVNACDTCNWWGAGQTGAPGYASPAGAGGSATAIPAPAVFMGSTRASAVAVTNSTVAITPNSYNCGSSGGSALSPPGPVATCILGAAPVTNSSGTVTSGSSTLNDPAGVFNSSIVGDAIAVQGAGAAGGTLISTITAVTSASQLTMGTTASTSISGSAIYTYGVSKEGTTGTTTASSSPVSCSTTGTIPASCDFTDTNAHFASSDLNKAITIYGAGPAASPLTTSIIKVNSATSVELGFETTTAIAGTAGYTYGTLLQGSTGTATAASKTFSDPSASFVSGNVGDDIVITGAGPSGASLVTTIAAVNSSTSITLGTAASTSVSGSALYAYGTPSQGRISGSFTVPSGLTCGTSCNVYIDEPDTTLTNGNYSGGGSYNVGLSYNLVNAVEGSTTASCTTGCGTVTSPPTVTNVSPNNGPAAGTNTVTVTGTGFTGATAVDFGTSNPGTSINVTGSTSLTVTAPSGTGTVNVTVTTPNGTSAVNAPSDQYTYNAAPTVTSVTPNNGPAAGTNTVTVAGSGFVSGSTSVAFGSNAGTSVNVTNSGSLSVVVPSGSGTVSVTVTTTSGGSSAPLANAYTYNAAPTVTSVTPNNGPAAGTNTVTVAGSGFVSGSTSVAFGSSAGTSVNVTNSGSLSVVVPSGSGTVSVTVTTTSGGSSAPLANAYTYNAAPTVTSVTPNNGPAAGTNTVTVAGSGFVSGSTSVAFGSNAGTSVNVTNSGSLSVVVPSGSGTVSVTVTTTSGGSSAPLANAYTYNAAPTVTSVTPNNGPAAGTNTVTVAGSGFVSGSTSVAFGSNAGTSVNVTNSGSLSVVVPSGSGTVSVTVTTTSGGSSAPLANAYTYNAAPTVTSVTPNNGPAAGTNTVTVAGSGFVSGSTSVDFGSSAGTSVNVTNSGSLSVVVPSGSGTVSVTVTTTSGGSSAPLANAYTYNAAPTVTSVTPNNGPAAGTNTVTVAGSGFVSGSTSVAFGSSAGTSVNVTNSGSLSVVVPSGSGTVSVTVTTTSGGSSAPLANAYTYNAAPTVTSVTPNNGPAAGTNTVTVAGSGFVSGSTSVAFGSSAGTSVNVTNSGSLSVVVPSGSGTVSVTVTTTSGGSSAPLANAYTYNGSIEPGGTVALYKSTALIGNYSDKVSGTGWTHDTTVTLNECASTTYSAATCDAANQVSGVTLGTGRAAGIFKNAVIAVAVGTIDSNGDTCGLVGSTMCYVVVVGNTADTTASGALSFALPSFTVKKTTDVLGNFVDAVKAVNFPIGDTVVAQECDASVLVPSTVSTHCDAATQISGVSGASGKVMFSATGVTLLVGSAYSDSASGTCELAGSCDIGVTDSNNAAIGVSVAVGFASPPTLSLKETAGVLGNYVDTVKAAGFPIGDTVVAQECDSNVSPTTVTSDCDAATQISGTASARGAVTFSPTGVKLLVGGAFSDSADGACSAGGTCEVVVTDSSNASIGADEAVTFAVPTVTLKETTGVEPNYVDKVTATEIPGW